MTIRRKGTTAAGKRGTATRGTAKRGTSKRGTVKRARQSKRAPDTYGKVPPRQSQRIALQDAVELTQRYRKSAPASEHAGFFWAEGIQEILTQPGCVGLRYYHGLGADGAYRMVLVGVDAEGNDITAPTTSKRSKLGAAGARGGEAVLLDHHFPCPPYCPSDSPLL